MVRGRIADGTYPPRTGVPSVVQLTSEFGVANATAHKALRALREEGLMYTEPGLGSSSLSGHSRLVPTGSPSGTSGTSTQGNVWGRTRPP
ncbi:GntR family transcriptional regulator [Streptomyces massasporeus]